MIRFTINCNIYWTVSTPLSDLFKYSVVALGCEHYSKSKASLVLLLPPVPGSSPLTASSIAKVSS